MIENFWEKYNFHRFKLKKACPHTSNIILTTTMITTGRKIGLVRLGSCYSIHLLLLLQTYNSRSIFVVSSSSKSLNKIYILSFVYCDKRAPCESIDKLISLFLVPAFAIIISSQQRQVVYTHHTIIRNMLCIHIVNHCPLVWLSGIYLCLSLLEVHHILTTSLVFFYRAYNFLYRTNKKKNYRLKGKEVCFMCRNKFGRHAKHRNWQGGRERKKKTLQHVDDYEPFESFH